jgi:hypothetical protein
LRTGFSPIIAGYHFSRDEDLALSLNVWAPTGKYENTRLGNTRLNHWSFTPQMAYTRIWPESGFAFDMVAGVEFYTWNPATDYHNAPLWTI